MSNYFEPQDSFIEISTHHFAKVLFNDTLQQHGLFALETFNAGDIICNFSAKETHTQPNFLTIQVSAKQHISLFPEFLKYTNHSCEPNVFFNTENMNLIAIKEININDELCFFYPSTELSMSQPFDCNCGTRGCLKIIKGATFLPNSVLHNYQLNSFVKNEISKQQD
jgi:hypothetical protein